MKTCLKMLLGMLLLLGVHNRACAESMPLAGQWKFDLDPDDRGLREQWFTRSDFSDTISLPGTTDTAGKGVLTVGSDPGSLTRVHKYYGAAWYSTEITIPADWQNKSVDLFLERVIWESRAWVDGKPAGMQESLDTPHVHSLGVLTPGKHQLTLRISNSMIHPIGVDGHNFTEQTQTIWNGAVGRVELQPHDLVQLRSVRAFPNAAAHQLKVEANILNQSTATNGSLVLTLRENDSRRQVAEEKVAVNIPVGQSVVTHVVSLPFDPKLWDEFSPNLYTLDAAVGTADSNDLASIPVGFRSLSRTGQQIAINGRPIFVRGNMDHCVFPLTGYPSMDVEGWRKVFRIYKSYGMNQMRCHSWTPPAAAFQAADEMGIYIQAEIFWMQYPLGSGKPMGDMKFLGGGPAAFMHSDESPDDYVKAEMRRVTDTYGNHPSLVFVVIGNELGHSVWDVTSQWVKAEKEHDPRHLYAASTAREITATDDFSDTHAVPKIGWVRDRIEPFNDWDYGKLYAKAPVPIIAHELGQWPTYPRWSEIDKFTGVVRARDLEACRDSAIKYGVVSQDEAFHEASGAMAIRLYKDEMESHLRTPGCSGFSTLCMQDYPGQGEALVGWLDSFFDSKGIVTPDRFRRWCNSTVPLARLPKYIFKSSDSITGSAVVAHYGPVDFKAAAVNWRLLDTNNAVLRSGEFPTLLLKTGTVTPVGDFAIPLAGFPDPARLRLELQVTSGNESFANDWDLWVYPDNPETKSSSDVLITSSMDEAKASLVKGGKVLLLANKLGAKRNKLLANFKPVYWSQWYFPWSETLGALVQNQHPALAQFPTDPHYDWEWFDLCKSAHGFVVDNLPPDFLPIVQPVPDFHLNHKYATLFEVSAGNGGKLLVSGYDLESDLANRPAAAQLRLSLLNYMETDRFNPVTKVSGEQLAEIFPIVRDLPATTPPTFKDAVLYVTAKPGIAASDRAWERAGDDAKIVDDGFDYSIHCDSVRSVGAASAWHSPDLKLTLTVTKPNRYEIFIHFIDVDRKGRLGTIRFGDNRYALPSHTGSGVWLKIDVMREDCLGGKMVLDAHADSGPDLQMDAFALVPVG